MRTIWFRVGLALALVSVPALTAQTAKEEGSTPAEKQVRPKHPAQVAQPRTGEKKVERPAYGIQNYSPLAAAGGYKRPQQNFFEFYWSRFNPRNINYGAWIEQRRRVWLEQVGVNRYFWFSFWAFAAICFLLLWATKERMDRKDLEWQAAEWLADLANYADHCKRKAFEAINKHNAHIEVCNRVIESAETGQPLPAGSNNQEDWNAVVDKLQTEVAARTAEAAKLSADLAEKTGTVTDLTARIDELARTRDAAANGSATSPNMELVARVNRLTTENHALRDECNRLKRGYQNAGSGERVR